MKIERDTLFWIVLGAVGIFLIIGHNLALSVICKVLGAGMVLSAVFWLINAFRDKFYIGVGWSVITLLIGLWIFGNTGQFITFINVVLGLALIASGGLNLYNRWKWGARGLTLLYPAISIVLGLIIACNNAATSWVVILTGVGLLYSAVLGYLGWKR